jgi:hypothetical protein
VKTDPDNQLFEERPWRPGFVYILMNDSMPGLLKIGRTSRDVGIRASELFQTGVPTPFEVYAKEKTCDCVQLEAFVHGSLSRYRVSQSREFFACDLEVAREELRAWAEWQASDLLSGFFDCAGAVPHGVLVAQTDIERLAQDASQATSLITSAMGALTAEELQPAIDRVRAKIRAEHFQSQDRVGIPKDEQTEPEAWMYL